MKNPNLPRFLTTFSVFAFKSHSNWIFMLASHFSIILQSGKIILNDFWKQKQKKLSKIWEDLDFWSFKIKIGCLYIPHLSLIKVILSITGLMMYYKTKKCSYQSCHKRLQWIAIVFINWQWMKIFDCIQLFTLVWKEKLQKCLLINHLFIMKFIPWSQILDNLGLE